MAEETERCVKEVKTLREQVSKLEADLKYTKVSFWIAYLLYNTTTITTTKQIFTELGSEWLIYEYTWAYPRNSNR